MEENYKPRIPSLKAGSILNDRFRIIESLDDTELCKNYLGRDIKSNNYVVIKELIDIFDDDSKREQAAKQFKTEASILITLVHPAIPTFRDYFEFKNRRYIIMDYVQGKNLFDLVKSSEKFFEETLILKWATELCDVLHYLHTRQPSPVIFRALSPNNVILSKEGRLKLIDFGISKKFNPKAKTMAVVKMGTPNFSPMEQYAGLTDIRSDIYSLGATLYYVITKTLPVDAIERSMNDISLPSCRELHDKISPELEAIVTKAMALDKEARYQTIQEMRSALRNISKFGKRVMVDKARIGVPEDSKPSSHWVQPPSSISGVKQVDKSRARPPLRTKRLTLPGLTSDAETSQRPPLHTKPLNVSGMSEDKDDDNLDAGWQRPPLRTKKLTLGDLSSTGEGKSREREKPGQKDEKPSSPFSSISSVYSPGSISSSIASPSFKVSETSLTSPSISSVTPVRESPMKSDAPASSPFIRQSTLSSADRFATGAPPAMPRRSGILEARTPRIPSKNVSPGPAGSLPSSDALSKAMPAKTIGKQPEPGPGRLSSISRGTIDTEREKGAQGRIFPVSSPAFERQDLKPRERSAGATAPLPDRKSKPHFEAEKKGMKFAQSESFDADISSSIMETDDPLEAGTIVNEKYKVLQLIDTDQATRTYKALDINNDRHIALKELLEQFDDPVKRREAVLQFQVEAKILIRLEHPSIPKFEEYFSYNGRRYFVIEFVEGENLEAIVQRTSDFFTENKLIDWSLQLCEIIEYMHSQSPDPVIYRDLSPKNVILTSNGKVKLVDFGISKIFTPDTKTMASAKIVNPHYSPIEQYAAQTDERTDIYSLGATLYYLITKTVPVDAIDRSISNVQLKPCRLFNKNISPEFEEVILKSMEVQKESRYQKVREMKLELLRICDKLQAKPQFKVEPEKASPKKTNVLLHPAEKLSSMRTNMLSSPEEPDEREELVEVEEVKDDFVRSEAKKGFSIFWTIIIMFLILLLLITLAGCLYYFSPMYLSDFQKFMVPWIEKLADFLKK